MSETTEHPATEPEREPAPTPTPAPESTPAPDDAPAEQTEEQERSGKDERRWAALTAQLSAQQRERDALRAENEFYRRQLAGQAPEQDTAEQAAQRLRMEVRAEVEAEIKIKNLHAQGYAQYADWDERRGRVVDMGGDAQFANLIVDMPPGEAVRVVAALSEDPEALQRIVKLEGDRARGVALGKYAATLDADNGNGHARAAAAPLPVTRAPAPVRPVTGRASPVFNEYTAPPEALADYYLKKDLERHRSRR
jgi:hypothetical protein